MAENEERIEIPGHGRLEIRNGNGEVVYRPDGGLAEQFVGHPLLTESGALRWATTPHEGRALVGRVQSELLHFFDAKQRRFRPVAVGERLARVEQLAIAHAGDLFIAVTESCVIAINAIDAGRRAGDEGGRERWRINQTTYDWSYVGRDEETVFFSDAGGNLLAFDPDSGREASL